MAQLKEIFLKDYTNVPFDIKSVDLVFDIYEDYTMVTNIMEIRKVDSTQKDIVLDSIDLELQDIFLDSISLTSQKYIYKEELLYIFNVPDNFQLKIINKLYPHTNTQLEGLYKSGDIFCTQNEPEGFRRITPYLDRPDVMSIFTTTLIAQKESYPILLSNGNKHQCHDTMGKRHGVTWVDPHPKPSYLFALVAGNLGILTDSFTTQSGDNIELNIYCDIGNESKCNHAMKSLREAMIWDEEKYGREYDLDIYNIVAVDSFNMGAMENKGLNIFNSHYVLADEDTATDTNFMGVQSVIAHEYFHNWTGNRITCRSWFELTLKEGLTVFRDQMFSADLNSSAVQRIQDIKALRQRQFVEDASPTAHPIQPKSYISMNNFYTATVYEKGAEVIRMIHTLLGETLYRKATDLYFDTFDGQAVTIQDFLWAMSNASGIDLTQFERWYHQSGTPILEVKEEYHNQTLHLTFVQKIPNSIDGKEQHHYFFPLKIGIIDIQGEEVLEELLIIKEKIQTFTFENIKEKPILSINRDFSAPIIVKQTKNDYPFLMKYDKNSFTKYEATQEFALQIIEDIIKDKEINSSFIEAYGYLLDLDVDLSYKALLLELPSLSSLMQNQSPIDFEPMHNALKKLHQTLAIQFKEKLIDIYNTIKPDTIGKRAIRNRVLKLLSFLKTQEIAKIAKTHYTNATNMTDKVAALEALLNYSQDVAFDAIDDFYAKYKKDTLVINKYFSLIAASDNPDILQKVKELQNDEAYNKKVPNLVRSLLSTFTQNYKYFHAKDGSGYKFIADKIIEIDSINAQMASSLCGSFKLYKKLTKSNQEFMLKELQRIKSHDTLSDNSLEIINKILEN